MNIRPDSLTGSTVSPSQITTDTQVQPHGSHGGAVSNSSGDAIELSGFPSQLQQLGSAAQNTDAARVSQLSRAVNGGGYAVDSVELGKKIVSDSLVSSTSPRTSS